MRTSFDRGRRLPLLASAAGTLFLMPPAGAEDMLETDSVLVVGHVPAAAQNFTEPMTVVDAADILRSGATTIDEVLQRLPAFGFQGVNGNQNAGGYGATFVDLRNLNFNRTLVLIDGHRVVLSGIQTDEAVDLANIPIGLIDRIEVMPYGTAPRYGADAVAGVVNIVLKHDLDGASLTVSSGISAQGDGAATEISTSYGKNLDRGNISVGATWMHRQPIEQSDRAWAVDPIDTAVNGPNGQLVLTRGSAATLAGHAVAASGSLAASADGYDTSRASFLRGGLDRATVNVLAHYAITDALAAFLEASYSDRVGRTEQPPQALGLSGTTKHPEGFIVPAENPFNPYGVDVTLQRVLAEVGNQDTRSDNRLARVVAGLEGRLDGEMPWSLSVNHGESRTTFTQDNAVDLTHALQTVDADPAACAAQPGCMPADYFGAGSLSPAAAAYLRFTEVTRSRYVENDVEATFGRSFRVLPGAPWSATLGTDYRTEYGETRPDPVVLAGDQAGGDSAATAGGYNAREVFADFDLPLLRDARFAAALSVSAGARYVDSDLFGHFPVWKLNVQWSPVEDVHLRGGWGTARRVPAITEAFGGSTTSPLDVADPCDAANGRLTNTTVAGNCRASGLTPAFHQTSALIEVANGGNRHLTPEYSRNVNVGAELTPSLARNLTIALDYYKFIIHDAIDSLSDADPNFIPDQCFASAGLSSPLCRLVVRTASGPSAGQLRLIEAPDQNIGAIETDGVDVSLRYGWALADRGRLAFDWQNTVLLDYRVQETPGGDYVQEAGTFPDLVSSGSLTRFKSLLSTVYEAPRWSTTWTVRYIGGARVLGDDAGTPFNRAPAIWYHDVSASLHGERVTFQFGIDNVAGQKPPTLIDGISNTNLNTYDVVGRFYYARITVK